jgi:homoserine dehydrogenase
VEVSRTGNDAAEPATKRVSRHPFHCKRDVGLHFDQDLTPIADLTDLAPSRMATDEAGVPLRVLKFGGSVMRSAHDLSRVAGEIYRNVRDGVRVIAVVSAFEGETDQLLQHCGLAGGKVACSGIPDVVSLGEEKSAQLLRLSCERVGLSAVVLKPEDIGIVTDGDPLEGVPLRLNGDIAARAADHDVLIVPGFVGLDAAGRRTLLGRGGTDFSAIFIAGETGANLRLYKDVDGVYDHDPAIDSNDLARYERVSWQACLTIARPLLQPRAVEYASRKNLVIEVGAVGSIDPTVVGAETSPAEVVDPRRPLRVGLAGFGTVGQAVQARLLRESGFEITAILVLDTTKARPTPPACPPTSDRGAFFESEFDVLIDATGGGDVGKRLSVRQLASSGDLVSANKLIVAENYWTLLNLSSQWGGRLGYSATVGGSAPMIEMVRRARAKGPVAEIAGVLNGTVNFVLDEMARGATFEVALALAQRAGFAECDPQADLSGSDAAWKLRILAAEVWNEAAREFAIDIEPLSDDVLGKIQGSGERWIQMSSVRKSGRLVSGKVRFVRAREVLEIPLLPGEWNCLYARLESGETLTATGRGAGGSATAEAIMADLYDLAAGRRSFRLSRCDPMRLRGLQPQREGRGVEGE